MVSGLDTLHLVRIVVRLQSFLSHLLFLLAVLLDWDDEVIARNCVGARSVFCASSFQPDTLTRDLSTFKYG